MNGRKIALIVGGLVIVAGLAAALSAESGSIEAYGDIAVVGSALPRHDPSLVDPAVGMPAPGIAGETVSVTPGGAPTVILFLAHWCSACQQEVPSLTDWVETNGIPVGVDLIAVATSTNPTQGNYPPSAWLEREGFPFPVVYDDEDNTAGIAYGVSAYPFWVVVDSEGNVVQRFSGVLPHETVSDLFTAASRL